MFENVLGQAAAARLSADIKGGVLAPAMLFFGPPAAGKGTAGLELARVLSCEAAAAWNCACSACARHRSLIHPDLLLLGSRSFSMESAAAAASLLREESLSTRFLFIRSVRKLTARFSPVLWEDDPKLGKLGGLVLSLEEDLDELEVLEEGKPEKLEKLSQSIVKNVYKLEAEGVSELIPVAHIRRAAYWSRLAPAGRWKFLLIENAGRMQESGRNALLKLLEEPPERVTIVLTAARREGLIPTVLSRLRPYRFVKREAAVEAELIRRVFRDSGSEINAYLDSFFPVSEETLRALAAFFAASVCAASVLQIRGGGRPLPEELVELGRYAAPIAEAAGLGRPVTDLKGAVGRVLEGTDRFGARFLFPRFLRLLLSMLSDGIGPSPGRIGLAELWLKETEKAGTAVDVYNQNPALALERLGAELRRSMADSFRR
ncbi:MAG: DNA polymerase III [Treponema sp.]|nr:DNA polymerase III [Treponema sp.]